MRGFRKGIILSMSITAMVMILPMQSQAAEISSVRMSDSINISESSDDVIISEVLTYDEIASEMAKNEKISIEEAKKILGPAPVSKKNGISSTLATETYRTIKKEFRLLYGLYCPYITIYCRTSESGNYWGILEIRNWQFMRKSSNGVTYKMSGEVYLNLQSAYQIYYSVSADFWELGEEIITTGGEIGIGESAKIHASVTSSNSWVANISEYGLITTQQ